MRTIPQRLQDHSFKPILTEADRKKLWPKIKAEEGIAYVKWHEERYHFACIPEGYEELDRYKLYKLLEQVVEAYQAMDKQSEIIEVSAWLIPCD